MASAWTQDELARIGDASELQLASLRSDGTLRPFVTMWVVRVGDQLYVRSGYGRTNPWFRRAQVRHAGRIRAGGIERDALFEEPGDDVDTAVDAAYHTKYDHHGATNVDPMVSAIAVEATFRLLAAPGDAWPSGS